MGSFMRAHREDGRASPLAVAVIVIVVAALGAGGLFAFVGTDEEDTGGTPISELSRAEALELHEMCTEYFGGGDDDIAQDDPDADAFRRLSAESNDRTMSIWELCQAVEERRDIP